MALIFVDNESTCDSTDVSAPIYDRKTTARPFDTIHGIIRCLSLVQSLFKGPNASIWHQRGPMRMKLSGTDELTHLIMRKKTKNNFRNISSLRKAIQLIVVEENVISL